MHNCSVVTVSGSTFENNHGRSVFTDLPSRVSGGGLSITINDTRNSSVIAGRFSYTIQNCTFFNNSANSTVSTARTISILKGSHVNDRGGGLAFYLVNPSVVEIKVLHCNFTNNSAPFFGGGLYVFSPELVSEKDFTIADNHFEGNEAKLGGGISIGASFKQTDRIEYLKGIVSESVILNRNTFVRNRAMHGGAMKLEPGKH